MKKKIKLIIKIFFIISAVIIIFNKINLQELKQIKLLHPFLLPAAFILYNISQIISAFRVHQYLNEIKITPSFKDQLILYYIGMFYNTLLPGGIGGDAYKTYKFQKHFQRGYKTVIKALLIDRLSGLFAILTLIGIFILFSSLKEFILYISLLIILAPLGLFICHKFFFKEFINPVVKNFFLSLIIQTIQGITFLSILLSLGIHTHLVDFIVLFYISSVISVIPISIGGVGLRELTFLWGLEFLHINPAYGIVSAFLFFLITLFSSLIGALFLKNTDKLISKN